MRIITSNDLANYGKRFFWWRLNICESTRGRSKWSFGVTNRATKIHENPLPIITRLSRQSKPLKTTTREWEKKLKELSLARGTNLPRCARGSNSIMKALTPHAPLVIPNYCCLLYSSHSVCHLMDLTILCTHLVIALGCLLFFCRDSLDISAVVKFQPVFARILFGISRRTSWASSAFA